MIVTQRTEGERWLTLWEAGGFALMRAHDVAAIVLDHRTRPREAPSRALLALEYRAAAELLRRALSHRPAQPFEA